MCNYLSARLRIWVQSSTDTSRGTRKTNGWRLIHVISRISLLMQLSPIFGLVSQSTCTERCSPIFMLKIFNLARSNLARGSFGSERLFSRHTGDAVTGVIEKTFCVKIRFQESDEAWLRYAIKAINIVVTLNEFKPSHWYLRSVSITLDLCVCPI